MVLIIKRIAAQNLSWCQLLQRYAQVWMFNFIIIQKSENLRALQRTPKKDNAGRAYDCGHNKSIYSAVLNFAHCYKKKAWQ